MKAKIIKYIIENGERQIDIEIPINGNPVVFGFPIPEQYQTNTEIIDYLRIKIQDAYNCWIIVNPPSVIEIKDPKTEFGADIINL